MASIGEVVSKEAGAGDNIARVERNVKRLIGAGAQETDIEAYLGTENLTGATFRDALVQKANPRVDALVKRIEASPRGGFSGAVDRGASFNFSDELGGVVNAGGQLVKNLATGDFSVSPGQAYDDAVTAERIVANRYSQAHPVANFTGEMVGGLVAGGPAAGAAATGGRAVNAVRGVTQGAGFGAVAGAGAGEGGITGRADNAAAGAAFGGSLGAVVPAVANILTRVGGRVLHVLGLRNADSAAADHVLRAFERDGIAPEEALRRLQDWQAAGGKGEMLFDLGGENVRGLARAAAGVPGAAKNRAQEVLAQRQAEQPGRIADDVATFFNPSRDFYGTVEGLNQARREGAQELYQRAYEAPPLAPDVMDRGGWLGTLLSRPSMRSALQRAQRIAAEEGRDPASLGIRFDADGNPTFDRVLSWQTLDYVKRGLDDVMEGFRNPTTGRLALNEEGRAIDATRRQFVRQLRDENPAYGDALNHWAGPSQSLDALAMGRNIFKKDAEITQQMLRDMSEGEREFFRAGVVRALQDIADNTQDGANVARRIWAKQANRDRLRAAFGNQRDFDAFDRSIRRELTLYNNGQIVSPRSGPGTAQRIAETEDMADDPATGFFGSLASGRSLYEAGANVARDIYRRGQGINGATADALSGVLFNPDPVATQNTLTMLARRRAARLDQLQRNRLTTRNALAGVAAGGGGQFDD